MRKSAMTTAAVASLAAAAMTSVWAQGTTAPAAASVPAPLVRPGLWEITVRSESPGSDATRSNTFRFCFGAAAATDIRQILPPQHELGLQCQNRDPKLDGLAASWQITCTGKGGSLGGTGTLSFVGGGYQGQAKLDRKTPGSKPSKVTQNFSGRWLEACK